jgi:hypothetical protein
LEALNDERGALLGRAFGGVEGQEVGVVGQEEVGLGHIALDASRGGHFEPMALFGLDSLKLYIPSAGQHHREEEAVSMARGSTKAGVDRDIVGRVFEDVREDVAHRWRRNLFERRQHRVANWGLLARVPGGNCATDESLGIRSDFVARSLYRR